VLLPYTDYINEIGLYPAYLAAKWLCSGKLDAMPGGVYAPEKLLDNPDPFLAELKALGVEIFDSSTG
jgi:hypothetical protein